ncbi:importin-like protein [Achlya hypogyna]|uniref:Importin-like protein n=1 Tax=Achlya hypogyna TaxID=1202772 RepID=A0A1V9YJA6_ACHHY|nr:importin-like protein [Achlya hypogyna]
MDFAGYEKMLWSLMSPDNAERNQAESMFEGMKADSDGTLLHLLQVIRSPASDDLRGLAAVLLRRVLLRDEVSLWCNATNATQHSVKNDLLQVLTHEANPSIRRKLCDTVGELASSILEEGEWDELLPCMFNWITSTNVAHRESALRVFEMISLFIATAMSDYFDTTIRALFEQCLTDAAGHVALHALRALGMLLLSIDELDERDRFQPLLPLILQGLVTMQAAPTDEDIMEAMEVVIELMEPHASFFKPSFKDLVPMMVALAQSSTASFGTRQLAMEVLVSIAENAPAACRRFPHNGFVELVFPIAFHLMLDIPEEMDDDENEDISNVDVGSEALQRMAQAIGFKKALPTCFALVQRFASHGDWRHQYAALLGLTQVVEIIPPAQVPAVVDHVFKHLVPTCHPRVLSVALDAVGQLATDHGPVFQEQYHAQTIAILLEYMALSEPALAQASRQWKCHFQAQAATSLRCFVDTCHPELMDPYLEALLSALFAMLGASTAMIDPTPEGRRVQEHAVAAISSIAGCCGPAFARFYDKVLPPLKQLLYACLAELTATADASTMLCGITLECISLVGLAVGPSVFGADAPEVLTVMTQMQHSTQYAQDDILRSYLLQALLDAAMQQAEFEMEDDEGMMADDDDEDVQIAHINDKCVSIRTSLLEEKATACQMLSSMVGDLKEAFFPYVEQVTQVLTPLMTDSVHTEIRAASISAMPSLVLSPCATDARVHAGRLLNALSTEPELELQMTIMQAIKMCIAHAVDPDETNDLSGKAPAGLLNHLQLVQLVEGLLIVLAESFQRRAVRRARKAIEELDEEENEEDLDNDATEAQLQFILADCIGSLAKTHQHVFYPVFQETLLDKVLEMVQPHCLPEDRKLAVYLVDDILEHTGAAAAGHLDTFVPLLVDCVGSDYAPLRQAASYGLALCAAHASFAPFVTPTVELLWNLVHAPDAYEPFYVNATDNAVSALGRMLLAFDDVLNPSLFPQWLRLLPMRGDLEESAAVVQRLCAAVQNKHRIIFDASPSNVPALISVLAEAISAQLFADQEPVLRDIQGALRSLREVIPPHVMQAVWSSMSPTQQQALHALFA